MCMHILVFGLFLWTLLMFNTSASPFSPPSTSPTCSPTSPCGWRLLITIIIFISLFLFLQLQLVFPQDLGFFRLYLPCENATFEIAHLNPETHINLQAATSCSVLDFFECVHKFDTRPEPLDHSQWSLPVVSVWVCSLIWLAHAAWKNPWSYPGQSLSVWTGRLLFCHQLNGLAKPKLKALQAGQPSAHRLAACPLGLEIFGLVAGFPILLEKLQPMHNTRNCGDTATYTHKERHIYSYIGTKKLLVYVSLGNTWRLGTWGCQRFTMPTGSRRWSPRKSGFLKPRFLDPILKFNKCRCIICSAEKPLQFCHDLLSPFL